MRRAAPERRTTARLAGDPGARSSRGSPYRRRRLNEHDRERYIAAYRADVALHGFRDGVVEAGSLGDFFAAMWTSVPDANVSLDDVLAD
jgi:hypothetical protein